jgi:predicted transcriptional regulator
MKKSRFKSNQIRQFMAANPTVKPVEVAKKFNTNVQYIYGLRYMRNKKKELLVSTPSKIEPDKHELTEFQLRQTIERLLTIIDYLEGKLRRGHGTPV